jgi:hypothetical protein
VRLREADGFPACPFCGARLVFDRTGVRPHFLYRPRIAPAQVLPLLRRWADRWAPSASLGSVAPRLAYYPFWRYAREGPRRLVPAWATLESAWNEVGLPDAEQVFFDPLHVQGATVVEPTVPEGAARVRVFGGAEAREGDLVSLPVYETAVRFGGIQQCVAVEACSGTVIYSGIAGPARPRTTGALAWLAGGWLAMFAAATGIRPLGIAILVAAALAGFLYAVLLRESRRNGG